MSRLVLSWTTRSPFCLLFMYSLPYMETVRLISNTSVTLVLTPPPSYVPTSSVYLTDLVLTPVLLVRHVDGPPVYTPFSDRVRASVLTSEDPLPYPTPPR